METSQMTDILDAVLRTLYENMDKDGLSFEKELLGANKIKVSSAESDKIWDVLRATGLVVRIVGFGSGGKLELTPPGIQMMTRFGSYKNFLASQNTGVPPQVTISLGDAGSGMTEAAKQKPGKPKKAASSGQQPH